MLIWLENLTLIEMLRRTPLLYAAVNAVHILGLGLLFGSVVILDLRLLGFLRKLPRQAVLDALIPLAAVGLCLTLASGIVLFSVRASDYVSNTALQVKVVLVVLALLNVLQTHLSSGNVRRERVGAGFSLALWTSAIFAGRWIAFI